MDEKKIYYRNLRKYKYQLMRDYSLKIELMPQQDIVTDFILLTKEGNLIVRKSYAWDGPSGPTRDTKSFMRGSLIHDALYQLMRLNLLDYKLYRKQADEILKKICLEDGMWEVRAWYVYKSVRLFGEKNARPQREMQEEILCAP